jgi:hypothetical protein
MSGEDSSMELVTSALTGVPEPVQASFIKAVSHLVGGALAIPGAKFKQFAQRIEDTTAARSALTAAIAKATAEQIIKDPIVTQATAEVLLDSSIRKVRNRLLVAQSAAERLGEQSAAGVNSDTAAPPDDDWLNNFMRYAEDASSDRLQYLFGRILAGQVLNPGTFRPATLRVLSELDQTLAEDFMYTWSRTIGDAVDFDPEWSRDKGFLRWQRLSEAGLLAVRDISTYSPELKQGHDSILWSPMQAPGTFVNIFLRKDARAQWNSIPLTRIGMEIGSLLDKPDYEKNVRAAVTRLSKQGFLKIILHSGPIFGEVLWQEELQNPAG